MKDGLRKIALSNLLSSIASGLVQPYYSFLSVFYGVTGPLLGLVSSAGVVIPDVIPYVFRRVNFSTPALGFFLAGVAWIALAFFPLGAASTPFYLASLVGLGIASFYLQLALEPLSRGARGDVLGLMNQYARVGSIVATVVTGFIVGSNYGLNHVLAVITGVLLIASGLEVLHVKVEGVKGEIEDTGRGLLLANTVFYFVWSLAWPIFPVLEVYKFHMNELNLAILSLVSGFSGLTAQKWMNKLINRDPELALFLGRAGLAIYPLAYALATNVYELYLAYLAMALTSTSAPATLAVIFERTKNVKASLSKLYFWQGVASALGSVTSATVLYSVSYSPASLVRIAETMMVTIAALRFLASFLYLTLARPRRVR